MYAIRSYYALSFGAASTSGISGGSFEVTTGATLDLQGNQTLQASSVITGAGGLSNSAGGVTTVLGSFGLSGPVAVSGGELNFNMPVGVWLGSVSLSGGTLRASNPVTVTGTMNQSNGVMAGSEPSYNFV